MRRAALLLLLALPAAAEPITKAGDVLKARDAWNGKPVCVVGAPTEIDQRFGKATGKHLFRGKIDDGTGKLEIFAFGYFPPVALGERIEVCGKYNKSKLHKNGVVYLDEIEAVAILKGKGIAAGTVEITEAGIVARGKGAVTAQGRRPPSPTP